MTFLQTGPFFFTTTQKHYFLFFFPCFPSFLLYFFQHNKDKNKSAQLFFSKTLFWHPDKMPKIYFRIPTHYLWFLRCPQNTIRLGKNKQKKSWTKFWRNLGPSFDSKNPNLGPSFDSTASLYIYIYTVKLSTGPSLGVFKVINWAKSKLLTGPRSFSHDKNRGVRRFLLFSYHCVFWCPIIWQFSKNSLFQKRVQTLGFSIFCVLTLNFENYSF